LSPVAVKQFERARGRDVGRVVEVDAEELALGFHDADHAELQAADAQARAERVLAAEQFVLQFGAEHDEGAGVLDSSSGRNWPLRTLPLNTTGMPGPTP
jgi:hypothetical protein